MRARIAVAVWAVLLSLSPAAVEATVPASITVQGKLTDAGGTPLPAGPKSFIFRIFDNPIGGTQVWPGGGPGENQSLTTDAAGLWIGLVGAVSPLSATVFSDTLRWLEITVDGTTLPRARLVTGPYAYRVATVDGASGGTITSKVSIGSGHTNTGNDAFVAGVDNQVSGNYSAVGGGALNHATGESSVISGGQQNDATAFASAIGGGASNDATKSHSVVSGGLGNVASGERAAVGGGLFNSASADVATVAGGTNNAATAEGATVGGGGNNHARGNYSTIAGGGGANPGDSNLALSEWSSIGGGTENLASGWASTIAGGFVNLARAEGATVGGGVANAADGVSCVVSGGNSCWASGVYSAICGGLSNHASDSGSTVGGGGNNRAYGLYSTIAGGGGTLAEDSNTVAGWWGTISGGRRNRVTDGLHGTVAGGVNNSAGHFANVCGGGSNSAWGGSSVGGGESNEAGLNFSAVGGGHFNRAVGEAATVPGGYGCEATGNYSLAAGYYARAHHRGSFVWSGYNFFFPGVDSAASTAENQFIIRASGGVGIGTTEPNQALHVMGNILASGCLVGTNVSCPSDARFKTNIRTIPNALDKVDQLRGVNYEWKRDEFRDRDFAAGEQVGVIAQEVQKVVPQAVFEQKDGYLSVDYSRLVPLLIEGMKEQQKRIEALEKRLGELTP